MSTASAAGRGEFWPALGHHAWKAPLLINVVLLAAGIFLTPEGSNWFYAVLGGVFLIVLGASYATVRHNHALCERCISEMPLNPQALVTRRDRQLRWEHKEDRFKSRKALLVAVFAPTAVVLVLLYVLPKWASNVVLVLWLGGYQTYDILATRTHKILQPWCPYCPRDPGGGSFSAEPVPDPVEKATR